MGGLRLPAFVCKFRDVLGRLRASGIQSAAVL